jgi:tRNA(fMet)-specific endonuclease VapC
VIFLPDTNVFSRYLRDRPEDAGLCGRLERSFADCRLSAIVVMELEYGAAKQPEIAIFRDRIVRLKAVFPGITAFDAAAAYQTGMVRAHLTRLKPNAQPIGAYDALLAGQALALGATLVTHNTAEFSRVPGLTDENWQRPR